MPRKKDGPSLLLPEKKKKLNQYRIGAMVELVENCRNS